ncbi:MAG: AAA family ATPase, partial [Verrucomicrobiota bacterium]
MSNQNARPQPQRFDLGVALGVPEANGVEIMGYEVPTAAVPAKRSGYVFRTDILQMFVYWLHARGQLGLRQGFQLFGQSSSGKSSFVMQVAARINMPVHLVTCHRDTDVLDLWGRDTLAGDDVIHLPGPAAKAAATGGWLLLDESHRLTPTMAGTL